MHFLDMEIIIYSNFDTNFVLNSLLFCQLCYKLEEKLFVTFFLKLSSFDNNVIIFNLLQSGTIVFQVHIFRSFKNPHLLLYKNKLQYLNSIWKSLSILLQ